MVNGGQAEPGPLRGGCLCGAVRYTVDAPIEQAEHCFCTMCRKAHGAAFSTNALVPTASLDIQGQEQLSVYRSSPNREKLFCSRCGSQLFIRRLNAPEGMVIALGSLDDDPGIRPGRSVFAASKAAWINPPPELPVFGIYPGHDAAD